MDFIMKDLEDIVPMKKAGATILVLRQSRGGEGDQERFLIVEAGIQEARAIEYLFDAIKGAVLALRAENVELRARLAKLEGKPTGAKPAKKGRAAA